MSNNDDRKEALGQIRELERKAREADRTGQPSGDIWEQAFALRKKYRLAEEMPGDYTDY